MGMTSMNFFGVLELKMDKTNRKWHDMQIGIRKT